MKATVTLDLGELFAVGAISEDEAMQVFGQFAERFGWVGMFYARSDVECFSGPDLTVIDNDITDDEFAVVRASQQWNRIQQVMIEAVLEEGLIPAVIRADAGRFVAFRDLNIRHDVPS